MKYKFYFVRPVYNRPEMLYLSLESEIKAREYCDFFDITTIFLIEYGSPPIVEYVIDNFKYDKIVIKRNFRYGDPMNQFEGIKLAVELSSDFIFYSTDDIIFHYKYFLYMKKIFENIDLNKISVINAQSKIKDNCLFNVYYSHDFSPCAPLFNTNFVKNFLTIHANPTYYIDKQNYCKLLNMKYSKYWGKGYKFGDKLHHHSWDGVCNRMVDVAMIENNMYVIMPSISLQRHIGFFGSNRQGNSDSIVGDSFDKRVESLSKIISDISLMNEYSYNGYNDYEYLDKRLNDWDGNICLKGLYND